MPHKMLLEVVKRLQ